MKRFLVRATVLVVASILVAVALPSFAFAGVSEYQVQFTPADSSGNGILIVNVILSQETTLPARVRVPLPAGSVLLWSGEILGGDVANDPSREASVTVVGDGMVAEFTLEKVRVAQVEAQWSAPTVSGDKVTANLEWVNTTEAGTYTFAVRLPAGVSDVKISPAVEGEPITNAAGESLRTLTPVRLEKGGKFPVSVSYRTGGASTGSPGTMSPVLIGAIVLLVIAVAALVIVVARQSATRSRQPLASTAPRSGRVSVGVMDVPASPVAPEAPVNRPEDEEPDDEAFTWE